MIESEKMPTLCPRCVHFTKGIEQGCRIGNYGIGTLVASRIRRWLQDQDGESSWTYRGLCPSFRYNDGGTYSMSEIERRALRILLGLRLHGE